MEFILFLIAAFAVYQLLKPQEVVKIPLSPGEQKCPPHKWVRKNEGTDYEYTVCEECKMLPGGEYYEVDK